MSAALKGLAAAGVMVPICGLAKRDEELFVPGKGEAVLADPEHSGMLLLRAARDESHRFALRGHRRRRSAKVFAR